jgi:hypothetical protein
LFSWDSIFWLLVVFQWSSVSYVYDVVCSYFDWVLIGLVLFEFVCLVSHNSAHNLFGGLMLTICWFGFIWFCSVLSINLVSFESIWWVNIVLTICLFGERKLAICLVSESSESVWWAYARNMFGSVELDLVWLVWLWYFLLMVLLFGFGLELLVWIWFGSLSLTDASLYDGYTFWLLLSIGYATCWLDYFQG